MLVVVASSGESLSDLVDERFGRCKFFLLINVSTNSFKLIKSVINSGFNAEHAAGVSAAQQVINSGAEALIANRVGPKALSLLSRFNVAIYQGSGVVRNVINRFLNNELVMIE